MDDLKQTKEKQENSWNKPKNIYFYLQMLIGIITIVSPVIFIIHELSLVLVILYVIIGFCLVFCSIYFYRLRANRKNQVQEGPESIVGLNEQITETFIVKLIIGGSMLISPLVIIMISGAFDIGFIIVMIAGMLLLIYSIRFYQIRKYISNIKELRDRLDEATDVQFVFAIGMIIISLVVLYYNWDRDRGILDTFIICSAILLWAYHDLFNEVLKRTS